MDNMTNIKKYYFKFVILQRLRLAFLLYVISQENPMPRFIIWSCLFNTKATLTKLYSCLFKDEIRTLDNILFCSQIVTSYLER